MADVGVLNLQIHDNSEQAVQGLDKLTDALLRIRDAVSGGLKLTNIATGLQRIGKVVDENIHGSTIEKLRQLSESLSGLKGLGNVHITIKEDGTASRLRDTIASSREEIGGMSSGFEQVADRVSTASRGFETFYGNVKNASELVQNTKWTAGVEEFNRRFSMMSKMRSMYSLGSGSQGRLASGYGDTSETGWSYYNPYGSTQETGWTTWKDGAIEVEGTVSDAMDTVTTCLEGTQLRLTGLVETTNAETSAIENSIDAARRMNAEMAFKYRELPQRSFEDFYYGFRYKRDENGQDYKYQQKDLMSDWLQGQGTANEQQYALQQMAREFGMTIDEVKQKIADLKATAESASPAVNNLSNAMGNASSNSSGMSQVNEYMDYSKIDLMTMKMNGMKDALAQDIEQNKLDNVQIADRISRIQDLSSRIEELKQAQEEATDSTSGLRTAFSSFKAGIQNLGISKLLGQFARIAKYRFLRSVIRQITSGVSEGIENVYWYSKAVGTDFAPAMDSAASSLAQMKNSIGASLTPILQSLIPILQTLVNWFITLINYINQFFSLLNGQATWTKALATQVSAYTDSTKKTQKATSALKDLLADWDELNIIQSQTGSGGGSGSTSTPDYSSMFEEVSEYADWIKNLTDAIKEQFGDIWGLVKRIALAILGWKFANAFTGVLATLGALVAGGALIDLEWNISTMLNKKYLETGEIGWLIADILQALIGGVLMQKVLGKVLGGQYAYIGIPLMLTVNATARIFTLLGNADVSALSEEGLISNIVSALELGGVAGYLAYTSGASMGQAIAGGAAATLIIFGALTNLKASVDAIRNEEVTADTIKATALGSVLLSIGSTVAAKLLVPGVSTAQAMGFGLATGAAVFLLTMGATIGIVATEKAAKSGISEEVLLDDLKSSMAMGLGAGIIIKMVTGNSWLISMAGGAGVMLATASALIGIQATCEAVQNKELTSQTIIDDATASLLMGGGVAIIGGVLCGLGAGAALTVGGLAALATFGALIGIQALLVAIAGEDKVKWGDYVATSEEIQNFVNTQVFSVKLPVAISLVKEKIEDTEQAEKDLNDQVGKVLPIINTLLLGFDIKGSLDELDKEVFGDEGLIKKYNATIKEKKAEIEAALVLVPIKDKEGNDISAEYLKQINQGWTNIDNIMSELGTSLSKSMKDAYDKSLDADLRAMALKSVTDITQTMLEVSTIIANSQSQVKMRRSFEEGLSALSGGSISEMIDYYKEQKAATLKDVKDTYSIYYDDLNAQKLTNEMLLQKAIENGGEYAGHSVEYYQAELERIESLYKVIEQAEQSSIDAAMQFYTNGEGLEKIRKAILDAIVGTADDQDIMSGLISHAFESGNNWGALFDINGNMVTNAKDTITDVLYDIMSSAFGSDNAKLFQKAIDEGIVTYTDIFGEDFISRFSELMGFNGDDVPDSIKTQWQDFIISLFGGKNGVEEAASEAAEEVRNATQEALNNTEPITVGENAGDTVIDETVTQTAAEAASDLTESATEASQAAQTINRLTLDDVTLDTTDAVSGANAAASAIEDMVSRIRTAFQELNGMSFSFETGDTTLTGIIRTVIPVQQRASGGFVRSGDLVMANENGNFEMMGKMGNQPVVANNSQIIEGISTGVGNANSGMESRLGSIEDKLARLLNKELVARAEPSSSWGNHANKSAEAWERVNG